MKNFFTKQDWRMRDLLASSLKTATFDGKVWRDTAGPGSTEGQFVDWLTIEEQSKSVAADVKRIRNHPLVPGDIPIYGYVYDVTTGRLVEVPEATETCPKILPFIKQQTLYHDDRKE